ncbi:lipid-A-disaccharide synthase [Pelistega indica]|uniref:Lipid-A-disaccharide synthase n=1 Tax=Pelistega indica TaxID=1414851 RepID=V8G7Y7_9BURK|nr:MULTISPECIES: lipid-A-disaccharide synthase [Pelistega]ETD72505.1 lipid-A-disaccharide synthase [Pelistega indica]
MSKKIAIVAGEPSGDLLASRIIKGMQDHQANLSFNGIGGPNMAATGMHIDYPMDLLTVFGYVDALKSLPKLIATYKGLEKRLLMNKPDVYVGVDAPDFNLRLEHKLKANGIPTVHFVGPSIWAWRYERIHQIREAVSHMLVLFPFETAIYKKEGIPVTFVGHPLASQIPLDTDIQQAKQALGLPIDAKVLAILPGSRSSEIKLLAEPFLKTAQLLAQRDPNLHFIVPLVNEKRKTQFNTIAKDIPVPNLHIYDKKVSDWPISWNVMQACDAALVASGTATLETALFKKPMVISYKLSPLVRKIMEWKSGQEKPYVPWVGLPNVLLNEFAVPELLQEEANPNQLSQACIKALEDVEYISDLKQKFHQLHLTLKQDTAQKAAEVILSLANR